MGKKYEIGDVLDLRIEKIVPRGFGLAFAEELTLFVPLAAVGDTVRARIAEIKGGTAFAEIEAVLEPSRDRVTAPCEYFGSCGGCDFQQMSYAAQLEAKAGMIRDCLLRIAKLDIEIDIELIASPNKLGYRSRAQWHIDTQKHEIGYYKRNSRDLVNIERCIVLAPELQNKLENLRSEMRWEEFRAPKGRIDAAAGSGGTVSVYSPEIIEATNEITFSNGSEIYKYSARSFFQENHALIPALLETALNGASGERALDLYCGVGLFTLPMARKFSKVIGVEDNASAIDFAKANSETAGLGNINFRTESVRKFLASGEARRADFILLDPPRAGTEKDTIQNIIKLEAANISYVACEPSVLARDLRRFAENGYKIDSITAIDLFPQTHHVETVVRLSK